MRHGGFKKGRNCSNGEAMEKLRRCRALHNIVGHQGVIKAQTKGTVEAEMENLGRHLIKVQWDSHIAMYVFPEEIELIDPIERWASDRNAA